MTHVDSPTVLDPGDRIVAADPTARPRDALTAAMAVLGPVLFVLSNVVYPSLGRSNAAVVAHVAPIAGRVLATHLLYAVASLLLVPFAVVLCRITARRGSVLRFAGAVLIVLGAISNALGEAVLAYSAWGMARASVPGAAQVRFFDLLDRSNAALPIGFVAIPVLSLGLLLAMAGVALSRAVPVWLPVAAVVGALVSGVVGTGLPSAVGFVWAAAAVAIVVLIGRRRGARP
jgi:hypothetical protein